MRLYEHRFPFPEYEPIRNYKTMKVLKKEMQEMNYYDKEERQGITMPLIVFSFFMIALILLGVFINYLVKK